VNEIELLKKRLVPLFADDFKSLAKGNGPCEVFGGYTEGYINTDSYGKTTIQSDVLRCFCQPSLQVIGYAMGTYENPRTAMRLSDYKSGWLIVPTNEEEKIEFWCGGKYIEKISPVTPFRVKGFAGNEALLRLIEDDRSCLVIAISPRKELYLKNLIIGDKNNLILCLENGAVTVPRKNWHDFKNAYINLNKKIKSDALVIMRGLNTGRFSFLDEKVSSFFAQDKQFALAYRDMTPKNPMARNIWFSALGAV
jgi:hypothetical protein